MTLIQILCEVTPRVKKFEEKIFAVRAPVSKYTGKLDLYVGPDGILHSQPITAQDCDRRYLGR